MDAHALVGLGVVGGSREIYHIGEDKTPSLGNPALFELVFGV